MKPLEDFTIVNFAKNELVFRAILPESEMPNFWKDDRITSAALKDKNGLSVYRIYDRTKEQTLGAMKKDGFRGAVVSLKNSDCIEVGAIVKHIPTKNNKYHSEIHGSDSRKLLSDIQAKKLARKATSECKSLLTISA